MIRHNAIQRIACRTLRRPRQSSNKVSQEQNQSLHKGLEQLQKPPIETNPSTEYIIAKQRRERLNQAMINAACSFLVVLLAAQSYKSRVELHKAVDHLEAATAVLKEKQKKLKELVDPATSDYLAASCMKVVQDHKTARPSKSWTWSEPKLNEVDIEQQISAAIHGKLRSLIDPTDFVDDDRDKELVRELVKTIDPPAKKQAFTI